MPKNELQPLNFFCNQINSSAHIYVYTSERNKWMQRFQMQQETIEGLENDVEELSELKVLELAENYYVSTQNGYA